MPEKLLESCIPWAMLSSATNLLNFNVLIKKCGQQHVFSTQLKLNMSEMKKSKKWKYLWKRERKTWRGVNSTPPPQLKWSSSNIYRGHTMVLYFKEKCTHFNTLIHCPKLRPFANRDNLKKKILTPFKITLPLHRFIKKFLKIFQAHGKIT